MFIRIQIFPNPGSWIQGSIKHRIPDPQHSYLYVILVCDTGQCCGSGSGIRCLFEPGIQDPEKVFSGSRISDPGSQDHIFKSFFEKIFGKKFYNSLKIGPNFFLQHFKTKIIYNFVKFVAT
jgi:hypothetical protein